MAGEERKPGWPEYLTAAVLALVLVFGASAALLEVANPHPCRGGTCAASDEESVLLVDGNRLDVTLDLQTDTKHVGWLESATSVRPTPESTALGDTVAKALGGMSGPKVWADPAAAERAVQQAVEVAFPWVAVQLVRIDSPS